MKNRVIWCCFAGLLLMCLNINAKEWYEKRQYQVYSPRYFGANAFPFPELMGGKLPPRWEVEVRGEYHTMPGDNTQDIFARVYIPIVGGKAGVTVSGVLQEWYKTSEAVRDERNAVDVKSPIPCFGDAIINCYYQVIQSEKWADIVVSANIKTASGGRLCDARYTDAASYWFDANIGRNLWQQVEQNASIRMDVLLGFYCWMTNLSDNRQDDAMCYGAGMSGTWESLFLKCDLIGFRGYQNNGDRPLLFRTKLEYEVKKNVLSFRYRHGLHDFLYDSYSLAYIRCF